MTAKLGNAYEELEEDDEGASIGDSRFGANKRALYEPSGMVDRVRRVIVSPKRACCIAVVVFLCILSIALIAAFSRPFVCCTCKDQEQPDGGHVSSGHLNLGDGNGSVSSYSSSSSASNSSSTPPTATNGEPFPWENIRLPEFIVPLSYSIALHPNLTTFVNKGTVNVTFKLTEPQKFIVLHVKDLELENFQLETRDVNAIGIRKTLRYLKYEQLYVEFDDTLLNDVNYSLSIDFRGNLSEKLEGFYLSSYRTSAGEMRYLATTHFEPTYARHAFPCFDEPSLKATFRVSIIREKRHISLFNMPIAQTKKLSDNLYVDYFNDTVTMSTYLVAFIVCDYHNLTAVTKSNVTVSVYSPAEQLNQAKFALEVATSVLDFYNDFFGIPYPLPKHDLVAIPDFGAGAMENWGLTTYRETAILTDSNETSVAKIQQVALTIAHELGHQWFGDLVTMTWWNDLWLNEGFASFVENLGTEHVKPEWNMMDQFVLTKTQPALQLDSLASSHPISVKVDDPSDIESIFDTISYSKGAAIIYMLESFLGKKTLQRGLKTYLNTYKYKNAKTEDLWRVLSLESQSMNMSLDVEAIMDTWTQQMGFPLVTVERKGNVVTAKQQRFLAGSSSEEDDVSSEFVSKYGYKWQIPLTYTTDKSSELHLIWLNLRDAQFTIPSDVKWIKFNTNQTGFYRVMYSEKDWRKLIDALKMNHTVFSAADRASLLDDAFTLSRNNLLDPTIPLEMTEYLTKETDYVPWITALDCFIEMEMTLMERPSFRLLIEHWLRLLLPIINEVGWEDSGTHLQRLLRPNILFVASRYGEKDIIDKATKKFQEWKTNNVSVSPGLRSVVYTIGIKYGTYDDWKYCWDYFNTTQVPSEQQTLLLALGASRDPWVLSQYLEYSLQRDKIRPQNTFIVLRAVSHNPIGRDLTWRFVRSNWKRLVEQFGVGSFAMSNIISDITEEFYTEFDYHEVKSFFDSHDVGSGKRTVKSTLEKIRSKMQWLKKNEQLVEKWLKETSDDKMKRKEIKRY